MAKREPKLLRCDCPDCGEGVRIDSDGVCAHCGRDVCWVFEDRREYMFETIRRVDWWRVKHGQDRWSNQEPGFRCSECGQRKPWSQGAADAHPSWCDNCWAKSHPVGFDCPTCKVHNSEAAAEKGGANGNG
jgi:hypothetical protein